MTIRYILFLQRYVPVLNFVQASHPPPPRRPVEAEGSEANADRILTSQYLDADSDPPSGVEDERTKKAQRMSKQGSIKMACMEHALTALSSVCVVCALYDRRDVATLWPGRGLCS